MDRELIARPRVLEDGLLVKRCLGGDPAAWSALYHAFHSSLLQVVRKYLGRAGDASLAEEIAARVWFALVREDFRMLARFDVARGCRFSTFLAVLARSETRMHFRSERRRRTRERTASRPEASSAIDAPLPADGIGEHEFLAILTPAERTFYQEILTVAETETSAAAYSDQNRWQLRHRVKRKLMTFLFSDLASDSPNPSAQ